MFTTTIISVFFILALSFFVINNFGSVQAATTSLSAVCWPSSTNISEGGSVTWYVMPSGGTGVYTYSWSGTDALAGTGPSVLKKYSTLGAKTASVKVISGSASVTANCTTTVVSGTAAVSVGVKATTATTVATTTSVGPTCGTEEEKPEPCEVIIAHGMDSKGQFAAAVTGLPIVKSKMINFFEVPLSYTTVGDVAYSINRQIGLIRPNSFSIKKILVVSHSLGTISAFNYQQGRSEDYLYDRTVDYLYYDPPYKTTDTLLGLPPEWFADITVSNWAVVSGEITRAVNNGIISSKKTIDWSGGFPSYWKPGTDPVKLAFNDRMSRLHRSFEYASYLPEDTLEVAKKKAIASMSATTAWIDQNCPNKDVDVTTN